MSLVQVKLIKEGFTPDDKRETVAARSWSWADIRELLSPEWEIGGPAVPPAAIRELAADK